MECAYFLSNVNNILKSISIAFTLLMISFLALNVLLNVLLKKCLSSIKIFTRQVLLIFYFQSKSLLLYFYFKAKASIATSVQRVLRENIIWRDILFTPSALRLPRMKSPAMFARKSIGLKIFFL